MTLDTLPIHKIQDLVSQGKLVMEAYKFPARNIRKELDRAYASGLGEKR